MKILIVGNSTIHGLEKSYYRAAIDCNFEVDYFDFEVVLSRYVKGKKIGKLINQLLPIEQWLRKMNREMVIRCKQFNPNMVIIFGNAKILYGSLMTLKTINAEQKIVWIWPDTPLNMELSAVSNGLLVDLFGTYSSSSIPSFNKLNFQNVKWIPLGFDDILYFSEEYYGDFTVDIGFIGGWRPEREIVLEYLITHFPELVIEIHGYYWRRNCRSEVVRSKVKSDGIFGVETSNFFKKTRINLNVIDDTNFPAANMRFFEISGVGALQVCSSCLEMSHVYKDYDACLYFNDLNELKLKIEWILENPIHSGQIRLKSKQITVEQNTYRARLLEIIKLLDI